MIIITNNHTQNNHTHKTLLCNHLRLQKRSLLYPIHHARLPSRHLQLVNLRLDKQGSRILLRSISRVLDNKTIGWKIMFVFFPLREGLLLFLSVSSHFLSVRMFCFLRICICLYIWIYIYDGHVIILRYLFSYFETNIYLALYIYLLTTCNDLTKNNL